MPGVWQIGRENDSDFLARWMSNRLFSSLLRIDFTSSFFFNPRRYDRNLLALTSFRTQMTLERSMHNPSFQCYVRRNFYSLFDLLLPVRLTRMFFLSTIMRYMYFVIKSNNARREIMIPPSKFSRCLYVRVVCSIIFTAYNARWFEVINGWRFSSAEQKHIFRYRK